MLGPWGEGADHPCAHVPHSMCSTHTVASDAYAWSSTSSCKPFSLVTGFKPVFSRAEFMCMDWFNLALDCANATIGPMALDLEQMILVS